MLRPLLQLKTSLNIMKTHTSYEKRTLFINNYLVFSKNYIMPPYKKLQTLISAFIKNLIFGKNRDPCLTNTFYCYFPIIQGSLLIVITVEPYFEKTHFFSWFYKKLGPIYNKLKSDKICNWSQISWANNAPNIPI